MQHGKHQPSTEDQAIRLLKDPKFLFKIGQRVGDLGVVGEKRNRLIIPLTGIGRTGPKPSSVIIKGSSSSGKSELLKRSIELFPPDCVVELAGLSKQALVSGEGPLGGKIYHILEYRCGKDSQQLLRLSQSERKIRHEYTVISGSRRTTNTAERVGSPVVLTTTTDHEIFPDDETRFLSLWANESAEQNLAVVLARASEPTLVDRRDLPDWQFAMALLTFRPGDFEHPPAWLRYVAEKLPLGKGRVRRDWDRFLTFLNTIALCRGDYGSNHQLDVTFADYCVAYLVLEPVFASTLKGIRTQELTLGTAVAKLNRQFRRGATVQEIASALQWKESLVYKHAKGAEQRSMVRYEPGTREKNEKRLWAMDDATDGFLPKPGLVLRENPEIGTEVRFVNPFTGDWQTLPRLQKRKT